MTERRQKKPMVGSRLLLDEYPLIVLPSLAKAVGLEEAICLQQLHYWLVNSQMGKDHDGRHWVYVSLKEWRRQMPFWSESNIGRLFTNLKNMGLVLTANYNQHAYDRTLWYTIDQKAWDKFVKSISSPLEMDVQDTGNGCPVDGTPIPETTIDNTETTSKQLEPTLPPSELCTPPIGAGPFGGNGGVVRKKQLASDKVARAAAKAEAKAALDAMDGRVRAALEAFMAGTANGGKPSPILPQFIDKHGQAARDMIQAGYTAEQIGQAARWFYEKWAGKYTLTPTNMAANMNQWAQQANGNGNGNGNRGNSQSLQSSLSLGLE